MNQERIQINPGNPSELKYFFLLLYKSKIMIFVFNTQHESPRLKYNKEILGLQFPVYNENYLQSLP